jgi:hypothetical protein
MVVALMPKSDAEMWLAAEYFAVGGMQSGSLVEPNLPQGRATNKTAGLVTRTGGG